MAANAASRSIHFPEDLAKTHTVCFAVYTRLVGTNMDDMKKHLPDHLQFIKGLREKGIIEVDGPFYTPDGQNSGDGFYALKVDSLEEAKKLTGEDPLHKSGVRTPTVMPWAKEDN